MSENTTNGYGLPVDPDLALAGVKNGTIKVTENPNEVTDGPIIELMEINVAKDGTTFFTTDGAFYPFGHTRFGNFGAALENEGAELDDAQVEMIQAVIASSNKNAKAFKAILDTYNSVNRQNAKQAEVARVRGLKLPMSEETKQKGQERSIAFFANAQGISMEAARKALVAAGLITE